MLQSTFGPSSDFYHNGNILWRRKKAMYGIRSVPKDWQSHCATVLTGIGLIRIQSGANVYMQTTLQVYILAYADDIITIGTIWAKNHILLRLKEKFLIKANG